MSPMARTVSSDLGAAAVLGPTGESTESSLDSLIERARRQPTLAPSGWNGFPHDDKDVVPIPHPASDAIRKHYLPIMN